MDFLLVQFIEKMLGRAVYEYDDTVNRWAGWIRGFPGVYAQGRSVEETRSDLASALEDYVLISLREGEPVPGLRIPQKRKAYTQTR